MAGQNNQDEPERVVYYGSSKDRPTFDDKMANLRAVGSQMDSEFKLSDKWSAVKKGTVDRLKYGALLYGMWIGYTIVTINPIFLTAVPVIAAIGAVDAYKHGSNNLIYNSYRTVKRAVTLFAGDALTLAKLPLKAAAFIIGIDQKKDNDPKKDNAATGQNAQAPQAQPEVEGAGQGFGQKLSSVFGAFAGRDAAANANAPKPQVDITPAAKQQNVPKGPGKAG